MNYKWKIWKIFHRLQQNKVPDIRALWDEAFIFRALSHIFRAKSIQPLLQKMARTPMQMTGSLGFSPPWWIEITVKLQVLLKSLNHHHNLPPLQSNDRVAGLQSTMMNRDYGKTPSLTEISKPPLQFASVVVELYKPVYTMRQKGTNFLLCAFLLILYRNWWTFFYLNKNV